MDDHLISSRGITRVWDDLFTKGIDRIANDLSQFIGRELNLSSTKLKLVALEDVSDYFGGSETIAIGIHSTFSGTANGSLMYIYEPELAFILRDILAGDEPGTVQSINEIAPSLLREFGDIISSSFLYNIADLFQISINPAPSKVLVDMNGAILDIAMLEVLDVNEDVFVGEVALSVGTYTIDTAFVVIPSPSLLELTLTGTKT